MVPVVFHVRVKHLGQMSRPRWLWEVIDSIYQRLFHRLGLPAIVLQLSNTWQLITTLVVWLATVLRVGRQQPAIQGSRQLAGCIGGTRCTGGTREKVV